MTSIAHLLQTRSSSLTELRLKLCSQFEIGRPLLLSYNAESYGPVGMKIVDILQQSNQNLCLSILDVRYCGSRNQTFLSTGGYEPNDRFVVDMCKLRYDQLLPGFFVRNVTWNPDV
jgi:hypothetical protein